MRSTKGHRALEGQRRLLEDQLAETSRRVEEMLSRIDSAPVETKEVGTIEVIDGVPIKTKKDVAVRNLNPQITRQYAEAVKTCRSLRYQILKIDSSLSPLRDGHLQPLAARTTLSGEKALGGKASVSTEKLKNASTKNVNAQGHHSKNKNRA